jgi:hypothetical protein
MMGYVLASARDRSGKPEVQLVLSADGLGTDSPVEQRWHVCEGERPPIFVKTSEGRQKN